MTAWSAASRLGTELGESLIQGLEYCMKTKTKAKIRLAKDAAALAEHIDLDQVEEHMGGRSRWQFQSKAYVSAVEAASA